MQMALIEIELVSPMSVVSRAISEMRTYNYIYWFRVIF